MVRRHGPGILLENDFLLENSLNLKKQCLNFMKVLEYFRILQKKFILTSKD